MKRLVFEYPSQVGSGPLFSPQRLATWRKSQGLSQEGLARRAGLATVTIAKLEEGWNRDPRVSTLLRLAEALGCSLDALLQPEGLRLVAESTTRYGQEHAAGVETTPEHDETIQGSGKDALPVAEDEHE